MNVGLAHTFLDVVDIDGIDEDRDHILTMAPAVNDAMGRSIGNCGRTKKRHRSALCAQRRVLIALGWIPGSDYSKRDIRKRSRPAIKRLQKAVGAKADGIWGQRTDKKLQALLDSVGWKAAEPPTKRVVGKKTTRRKRKPTRRKRKPAPAVARDLPVLLPEDQPAKRKLQFKTAGFGIAAIVMGTGIALAMRKPKGLEGHDSTWDRRGPLAFERRLRSGKKTSQQNRMKRCAQEWKWAKRQAGAVFPGGTGSYQEFMSKCLRR